MNTTGARSMAARRSGPVVFMAGAYLGGNRYHLSFEPVVDFAEVPVDQREAQVNQALAQYVGLLERHCREAPYNWFNFYDFWKPAP